jgi:F-type H+-transporting ATPase subunit delta
MKINKQARREAKELFRSSLSEGVLDETRVRQAVQRVIERKPRGYLAILSHLERLIKLDVSRRTARVESAVPLAAETETQIKQELTNAYGRGLIFHFAQRSELIGGLRVQVGSDVYDGTIQARLARLEQSF